MRRALGFALLSVACLARVVAAADGADPTEALRKMFQPLDPPQPEGLLLREGDRLTIAGDSITEQRLYSRIIETYLTACTPELRVSVRQCGWGGETAGGFLDRLQSDCLRFEPTVVTTCYGMNDHGYKAFEEGVGQRYREQQTAIVRALRARGVRVVLGSPGCVSNRPEALNQSLAKLRNIDVEIARSEGVGFADVFWSMITAGAAGQAKYGPEYLIASRDTVHPGWAGHLAMAYAFLRAFGLDGEIGTFRVDLASGTATASAGHDVVGFEDGELQLKSSRYPYCATGELNSDGSLRSGMTVVPFNSELNRLLLVAQNGGARSYRVQWGDQAKSFTAKQLAEGVNLADEFPVNPFSASFGAVDAAVAAKQEYETRQIKLLFHGPEFAVDPEAVVAVTERARAKLVEAIGAARVPVRHTIRISPE